MRKTTRLLGVLLGVLAGPTCAAIRIWRRSGVPLVRARVGWPSTDSTRWTTVSMWLKSSTPKHAARSIPPRVARVGRNSVLAYCAAWEVWEPTSSASLNIEVGSTSSIQWINTLFNVTVKGGIRPVHRPLDKPLVHRIEVALIHMPRIIRIVTNSVFLELALPEASFAACTPHRRAPFTVRQALGKPLLNQPLAVRKIILIRR
jgi:hypothetical protein